MSLTMQKVESTIDDFHGIVDGKMTTEAQIEQLHDTLEGHAINSRGTKDVFGRRFNLPVDDEHKAKVFSCGVIMKGAQQPHLRAFWTATFGFFSCFFSVFAPAALVPYLKRSVAEGGIALTRSQGADAGSAAVASTIIMRMLCGPMCDAFGARKTFVLLLLLACPGIIGLIFIQSGEQLIFCRLVIGLGLAAFVTCQVWCSQMFNKKVVGIANATAGGWGNLGGGVTQLVMPQVMLALLGATNNNVNLSWRLCFIVPLAFHIVSAACILSGRDLPDGNYKQLEKAGAKQKVKGSIVAKIGLSNVNAWILFLTYGLCFGIELTMNNKVVPYFNRYYALNPQMSGILGSCFGLMNLFARSWGGLLSDAMNARYGMRGRLWGMWIVQTLEGVMCICMGLVTINMPNPDDFSTKVPGVWEYTNMYRETTSFTFNSSIAMVPRCGSKQIATPTEGWLNYGTADVSPAKIPLNAAFMMVRDPDNTCIHGQNTLGLTMIVMILFSLCVQAAEGLHFGIVPYVSRPALGVVSGMVGAGGNFGGVMGSKYIVNAFIPLDNGFINLGIVIIVGSLSMFGLYFPEHGGMLFKKGGLGSYDPQLIKPPAGMVGADQLNYANVKAGTKPAAA